ncbi:MAG TPA: DUF2277 domain-containing protein [Candidatus Saccharimonadia bacterium]|nr:DUF2277 domain-containing protein [Candidatus Saccharimonadia bacterium]
MCRNIKLLYEDQIIATDEAMEAAALQFVRKITGIQKPKSVQQAAYEHAIAHVAQAAKELLEELAGHEHTMVNSKV